VNSRRDNTQRTASRGVGDDFALRNVQPETNGGLEPDEMRTKELVATGGTPQETCQPRTLKLDAGENHSTKELRRLSEEVRSNPVTAKRGLLRDATNKRTEGWRSGHTLKIAMRDGRPMGRTTLWVMTETEGNAFYLARPSSLDPLP